MTDITKESEDIERELEKSEINMENIGTLALRIQKFVKLVMLMDNETMKLKAKDFNKRIVRLSNKRLESKRNEQEEMIRSRLTPEEPYTECSYYTEKTQKVNCILTDALGVLDSIQKQGRYINVGSTRIKDGLRKLGVSQRLVNEIDKRYLADNRIYVSGFVIVIIFFIILRFYYR